MLLDRTGQAMGDKSIMIDKEELKIKAKIGDVRGYLKTVTKLKKENNDVGMVDLQFDFFEKLIKQGNPSYSVDDVKGIVESYFTEVSKEILIALRLATRKDYEEEEQTKN